MSAFVLHRDGALVRLFTDSLSSSLDGTATIINTSKVTFLPAAGCAFVGMGYSHVTANVEAQMHGQHSRTLAQCEAALKACLRDAAETYLRRFGSEADGFNHFLLLIGSERTIRLEYCPHERRVLELDMTVDQCWIFEPKYKGECLKRGVFTGDRDAFDMLEAMQADHIARYGDRGTLGGEIVRTDIGPAGIFTAKIGHLPPRGADGQVLAFRTEGRVIEEAAPLRRPAPRHAHIDGHATCTRQQRRAAQRQQRKSRRGAQP